MGYLDEVQLTQQAENLEAMGLHALSRPIVHWRMAMKWRRARQNWVNGCNALTGFRPRLSPRILAFPQASVSPSNPSSQDSIAGLPGLLLGTLFHVLLRMFW